MRALARVRAVPLVALVAVVAALVVVRARDRATSRKVPSATRIASAVLDGGEASIALAPPSPSPSASAMDGEKSSAPRMLHGDPRHTHRALGVRGPSRAQVVWTAHVGGPVQAQVVASPDEKTLYVASLDGALTALASEDGVQRWSVPLGDRAYGTPCVADDGTIYVGSDARRFVAVAPSGTVTWKLEVGGEADTACVITSAGPAGFAGLVVFAAGADVYAVRPGPGTRGGSLAWRFSARKKVFTAPAIADDGTIVFGSQDHHVYALSPTGALVWSADLGADVDGAPAIADDGDVFVGTDAGDVVRLRAKSGEVAWRAPVGGFVRGTLALARDGDVLAGVYGPAPRLVRIAPDGSVRASFRVPGTGAKEMGVHGGALEDARGALFFGAQDDQVRALFPGGTPASPPDEPAWSYGFGADVDAPLTLLSSGALVVASDEGNVVLFAP